VSQPHRSSSVHLFGVEIANLTFAEAVEAIVRRSREGAGGYICTPNVDHLVRARKDPSFKSLLEGAWLRVPDGMGIVYGARIAGSPLRGTVTGRLLPQAVGRTLACERQSIALVGGRTKEDVEAAARHLSREGVLVSFTASPPMGFQIGGPQDEEIVDGLERSTASVVFVALGSPLQERWMATHAGELGGRVLIGVGAAVDVLSGRVPPAPAWMTRVGLEWLWRLLREPRRLAKRYLVDDPRFFLWTVRTRWSRRARQNDDGR
jgi:N-acetylglucosaminyldiphosphoundecaprenol N-acetyl-beta-D-mannosaminyltransferase